IELHPTPGHTADGVAYFVPWQGVLVCGDYVSPVEIPWISASGSAADYLATLERLRGLVARSERIVPGHGRPLERIDALRILDEDRHYLQTFAALPPGRDTAAQRKIHAENLERIA